MRSGDVRCLQFRAVRFRRTNEHFTFGRLEVGCEGRVEWQRQEWLVLKQFGILNFMHVTNVKQTVGYKLRVIRVGAGCNLLTVN